MPPIVDDDGVEWWRGTIYPQLSVSKDALIKALFQCPRVLLPQMSMKEASVYLDICLERKTDITFRAWERFLIRFGPFSKCVVKAVQCFQDRLGVAPWFHGVISRAQAEAVTNPSDDGAFLVRFSETQPDKFTLTYMKVHMDPLYNGRKEIKNVLIVHNPHEGYGLQDGGNGMQYPSIASFIEGSSARLRTPIVSRLSIECNATLKALQAASISMFSTSSAAFNGGSNEYGNLSTNDLLVAPPPAPTDLRVGGGQNDYGTLGFAHDTAPPSDYSTLAHGDLHRSFRPDPAATYGNFAQVANATMSSTGPNPMLVEANRSITQPLPPAPPPQHESSYGHFHHQGTSQPDKRPIVLSSDYGQLPPPFAAPLRTPVTDDVTGRFGASLNAPVSGNSDVYGHFGQPPAPSPASFGTITNPPTSQLTPGGLLSDYGANVCVHTAKTTPPSSDYGQLGQEHLVSGSHKAYGHFGPSSEPSHPSLKTTYGHFTADAAPRSAPSSRASHSARQLPSTQHHPSDYGRFDQARTPAPLQPAAHHTMVRHNSDSTSSHSSAYGSFAATSVSMARSTSEYGHFGSSFASASLPSARLPSVDLHGALDKPPLHGKEAAVAQIETGMALYKERKLDDATACFLRAEHCAKASGEKTVEARALGNLGTVYLDKKLPKDAVRYYVKCLALTRDVEDKKRERIILNNLVLASIASSDTTAALQYSTELLAITAVTANRLKIESRIRTLEEELRKAHAPSPTLS